MERVLRKAVEEAHREAGAAREERRLEEEKRARAYGFLSRLPARCRKAALEVLERYPGDGHDLLAWLGEGVSPTRDLLRQALSPLGEREVRERTFAWLGRNRRLGKDYEFHPEVSEDWMYLDMIRLPVERLARIA